MTIIGLINPGAMGASIGAAAAHNGATVLWAGSQRSDATRQRASNAGLEDCGTLADLVEQSNIILSVCPPHVAADLAGEIADLEFNGMYLEGNAIAPGVTRKIDTLLRNSGARVVDGGIIGGPAWKAEYGTKLYLSGEDAALIANLFSGSALHTSVIGPHIGSASALKMTFAAYTKGSTALLSAILAVAEKEGVRDALEQQWGEEFTRETHRRVTGNTAKAWRFAGEMREIAATFSGTGMPEGFHLAAAELFESLAEYKGQDKPPTIEEVLATLLR
ncbi:MAG: DUF1932 domain-containing protein [Pseudomonadales bacterium]